MNSHQFYIQFILLLSLILHIYSYKYCHLHSYDHKQRYDYKIYSDVNAMNAGEKNITML